VISTQLLIEFRSVLSRKSDPPLSNADLRAALEALAEFDVVPANASLVLDAHELAQRVNLFWFDTLIAEAATRSGCSVIYSEDFNHGQRFGELTAHNPFRKGEREP